MKKQITIKLTEDSSYAEIEETEGRGGEEELIRSSYTVEIDSLLAAFSNSKDAVESETMVLRPFVTLLKYWLKTERGHNLFLVLRHPGDANIKGDGADLGRVRIPPMVFFIKTTAMKPYSLVDSRIMFLSGATYLKIMSGQDPLAERCHSSYQIIPNTYDVRDHRGICWGQDSNRISQINDLGGVMALPGLFFSIPFTSHMAAITYFVEYCRKRESGDQETIKRDLSKEQYSLLEIAKKMIASN